MHSTQKRTSQCWSWLGLIYRSSMNSFCASSNHPTSILMSQRSLSISISSYRWVLFSWNELYEDTDAYSMTKSCLSFSIAKILASVISSRRHCTASMANFLIYELSSGAQSITSSSNSSTNQNGIMELPNYSRSSAPLLMGSLYHLKKNTRPFLLGY